MRGYRIWSSVDNTYVNNEKNFVLTQAGKILALGGVSFNPEFGMVPEFSTNLCDKNKKEIYENDLVSISGLSPIKIEWSQESYTGNQHDWGSMSVGYHFGMFCEEKSFEVVGNIHENPELLR